MNNNFTFRTNVNSQSRLSNSFNQSENNNLNDSKSLSDIDIGDILTITKGMRKSNTVNQNNLNKAQPSKDSTNSHPQNTMQNNLNNQSVIDGNGIESKAIDGLKIDQNINSDINSRLVNEPNMIQSDFNYENSVDNDNTRKSLKINLSKLYEPNEEEFDEKNIERYLNNIKFNQKLSSIDQMRMETYGLLIKIENFQKDRVRDIVGLLKEDQDYQKKVDFENMREQLENEMAEKVSLQYSHVETEFRNSHMIQIEKVEKEIKSKIYDEQREEIKDEITASVKDEYYKFCYEELKAKVGESVKNNIEKEQMQIQRESSERKIKKIKEEIEKSNQSILETEKRRLAEEMEKNQALQLKSAMVEREKTIKQNVQCSLENFRLKIKSQLEKEFKQNYAKLEDTVKKERVELNSYKSKQIKLRSSLKMKMNDFDLEKELQGDKTARSDFTLSFNQTQTSKKGDQITRFHACRDKSAESKENLQLKQKSRSKSPIEKRKSPKKDVQHVDRMLNNGQTKNRILEELKEENPHRSTTNANKEEDTYVNSTVKKLTSEVEAATNTNQRYLQKLAEDLNVISSKVKAEIKEDLSKSVSRFSSTMLSNDRLRHISKTQDLFRMSDSVTKVKRDVSPRIELKRNEELKKRDIFGNINLNLL